MQKCPACGYLLFGDSDACKHCGAALDRVGASTVANPVSGNLTPPTVTAAPPALGPTPPALPRVSGPLAALPPPPPAQPSGEFWAPVAITTPTPKRTTPKGLIAIMAIVAVVVALIAYSAATKQTPVPSGTRAFVDGRGVAFNAPDGTFSAQFPVAPTSEQSPTVIEGASLTLTSAIASGADYELGAASLVLPVTPTTTQAENALSSAIDEELATLKGQGANKVSTRRGGLPALEATFKAPDGFSAHILVMSFGPKLYVLFTHAKFGTEALFHALDKAFVVH